MACHESEVWAGISAWQHLDFVELLHDMCAEVLENGGSSLFDMLFRVQFLESCSACGSVRDTRHSMYLRLATEDGWQLSTPFEHAALAIGTEHCARPCTDRLSTPHRMVIRRLPAVLLVEPINQYESASNVWHITNVACTSLIRYCPLVCVLPRVCAFTATDSHNQLQPQPPDNHGRLHLSFFVTDSVENRTILYVLCSVLYHSRNHYQSLVRDTHRYWWHHDGGGALRKWAIFFAAHKAARLPGKRPRLYFYVAYDPKASQVLEGI